MAFKRRCTRGFAVDARTHTVCRIIHVRDSYMRVHAVALYEESVHHCLISCLLASVDKLQGAIKLLRLERVVIVPQYVSQMRELKCERMPPPSGGVRLIVLALHLREVDNQSNWQHGTRRRAQGVPGMPKLKRPADRAADR